MAAANGRTRTGLSRTLFEEPYRFDFFQAVRLLEEAARERAQRDPGRPSAAVGGDAAPDREHVRFRALPSQAFAPAPVSRVAESADGRPAEAVVTFFGLTGPQGALPAHYTSQVLRRLRDKDHSLRDFLDLFNHRALSLFVRAWEKYRLPFAYERAARDGRTDPVSQVLYCLAGYGTDRLRGRQGVPDEAFLFYAGHFAHRPRSAVALEAMLTDHLGLPVAVDQVSGQWLTLDDADRSRLPEGNEPRGQNCELGVSVVVGERVWDVQSKFTLRVGPLTYAQFRRFMPDGDGLRVLTQLTRSFVGPEFDFDVIPLLGPTEAPDCVLGGGGDGPRLGWNTWLHEGDYKDVRSDAIFFEAVGGPAAA